MSILDTFIASPKEERLAAEENRIYKIGFYILSIGVLLDICYGFIMSSVVLVFTDVESINLFEFVSPLVFLTLMVSCIVCVIMQTKKGFVTSNRRFADVDSFPLAYYLVISVAAGGACFLGGILLINVAQYQVLGVAGVYLLECLAISAAFGLLVFCMCLPTFWLTFKAAKARREKQENEC